VAVRRINDNHIHSGLDPMQLAQMEAAIRFAQVRVRVARRTKLPPPHNPER